MIEKVKTAFWFAGRPKHWNHAVELFKRKFRENKDTEALRAEATAWAAARAVSVDEALVNLGIIDAGISAKVMPNSLLEEATALAEKSEIKMGGPGDLNLLHAIVSGSKPKRIIETGVAYGWSSLAILSALEGNEGARLVSVDMPYPKMNNEAFVGIVVSERFRNAWTLVREPDRQGIEKAVQIFSNEIDLCHYDSDKSWWGRQYGFKWLWEALKPGGIFISDDIQDNMAFAEFVEDKKLNFSVTESDGKYVGILKKPI